MVTDFEAMPRRESDCSQDLKETRFFPVLFLIDGSVCRALAARLLLAVQSKVMTQFKRLIGLNHRVQVSENCRSCHGGKSRALLGSPVLQLSSLTAPLGLHVGTPHLSTLLG